jgi:hypothetical protein
MFVLRDSYQAHSSGLLQKFHSHLPGALGRKVYTALQSGAVPAVSDGQRHHSFHQGLGSEDQELNLGGQLKFETVTSLCSVWDFCSSFSTVTCHQ